MQSQREINDIRDIIEKIKNDPSRVDELKNEVHEKGLEDRIKDFEKKYSGKINDFMAELAKKGEMTDEEKARLVLKMKKSLPKDTQKQLSDVIRSMKEYLK
ncbi:MAG: hypothetical protein IKM61_08010 [Eubacteriaceae bacterium]|nr:hypothetical protein [Eubacteriaceae bacterium]